MHSAAAFSDAAMSVCGTMKAALNEPDVRLSCKFFRVYIFTERKKNKHSGHFIASLKSDWGVSGLRGVCM